MMVRLVQPCICRVRQ